MAKIPFDIKYRPEIESGKYKVVTKDGLTVALKKVTSNHTTILLAFVGKDEGPVDYDKCDDIRILDDMFYNHSDLFILTDGTELKDIELNEFEKALDDHNILSEYDYASMDGIEIKHKIRELANELLPIARKQLLPEFKVQYEKGRQDLLNELYCGNEEFKDAVSEKIRNMVSKLFNGKGDITSKQFADEFAWELLTLAKAEAYKDLPKWQHMYSGAGGNGEGRNTFLIRDGLDTYRLSPVIVAGDTYLVLHELDKLFPF